MAPHIQSCVLGCVCISHDMIWVSDNHVCWLHIAWRIAITTSCASPRLATCPCHGKCERDQTCAALHGAPWRIQALTAAEELSPWPARAEGHDSIWPHPLMRSQPFFSPPITVVRECRLQRRIQYYNFHFSPDVAIPRDLDMVADSKTPVPDQA